MKNNIIKTVLLLAILVFLCVILGFIIELRNNSSKSGQEVELIKSEKFTQELYTKQNVSESVINNNIPIRIQQDFFLYSDGKKADLLSSKPILVYRFSALSCSTCVDFGKNKIQDYFSDYKNSPDLLFVASGYPSNYQVDLKNFLNIGKNSLGLPLEQTNLPFYFILIDGIVQQVFIPDKSSSEYTDIYLEEIKRRYFN